MRLFEPGADLAARGYDRLIRSEGRLRTHPVLLQKVYEGAHSSSVEASGTVGLAAERAAYGAPKISVHMD